MASNPTQLPMTGFEPEIQDITRQRDLAKMLLQQGLAQNDMQGQIVSGRYVGASPWQGIAKMYSAYRGNQLAREADRKQAELAKLLREETATDIGKVLEATQGRAEVAPVIPQGQTLRDDQGQLTMGAQAGTPAVAPDYNKALAIALGSRSPTVQAMGGQLLGEITKPQKLGEGEQFVKFNASTGKYEPIASGGAKLPPDVRAATIFLGINKPESEWTTQERMAVEQKAKSFRESGAINMGQKGLDNTLKLRGDFRSEPIYKDFQAIDSAYRQINTGLDAKTAAGDLAASTKLMKLLDPSSVVRESELVMAMQATGKLDQLYNYANKIATGQFLSPTQKDQFRTLAREFYNSAADQYNLKRGEYADIAKRNELNVIDVVGPEVKVKEKSPAVTGFPNQDAIQAEINRRAGLKQQGGR